MSTAKPPYSAQFRSQILELVRAGRKPSELAREFGCHVTSILHWMRQEQKLSEPGALTQAEREELKELRRQLKQVQWERDILAKGDEEQKTVWETVFPRNAWFANSSVATSDRLTR